ncbi:hypothetical protein B0I37DRAFT_127409 [Chaetomium sp. MPI-CAGE-AT-0009]|nr:hypothetical protein B0I37DRAFT_127409 [Chaetomium sp. MPI-CAGE-AT-0009]
MHSELPPRTPRPSILARLCPSVCQQNRIVGPCLSSTEYYHSTTCILHFDPLVVQIYAKRQVSETNDPHLPETIPRHGGVIKGGRIGFGGQLMSPLPLLGCILPVSYPRWPPTSAPKEGWLKMILGPIIEDGALSLALVPGLAGGWVFDAKTARGIEGLKPKHSARPAPSATCSRVFRKAGDAACQPLFRNSRSMQLPTKREGHRRKMGHRGLGCLAIRDFAIR